MYPYIPEIHTPKFVTKKKIKAPTKAPVILLIKFLEKEAVKSTLSDVKLRIFSLIQEHIAEKSLANVRQEFIYKVIDKAYLSDYPSYPNKLQIRLSGIILGFLLAALLSISMYFFRNKN